MKRFWNKLVWLSPIPNLSQTEWMRDVENKSQNLRTPFSNCCLSYNQFQKPWNLSVRYRGHLVFTILAKSEEGRRKSVYEFLHTPKKYVTFTRSIFKILLLTPQFHVKNFFIINIWWVECISVSSVGIATYNGLDGPGSNPGGDEIFRPSRPVLGPTQPPVKWIQFLSRG